jgi:hypothetical protein
MLCPYNRRIFRYFNNDYAPDLNNPLISCEISGLEVANERSKVDSHLLKIKYRTLAKSARMRHPRFACTKRLSHPPHAGL